MSESVRLVVIGVVIGLSAVLTSPAGGRWLPSGTPVTTDQLDQAFPVLVPSGDGGVIVAWQEFGRIFAQKLTAEGEVSAGWPSDRGLEVCPRAPQGPYHQCAPRIAPDGDGGAFILWHDGRNFGCRQYCFDEGRELFVAHITSVGTLDPLWPDVGLPVGSSFGEMLFTNGTGRLKATTFNTTMAPDDRGGVVITWEERPPLSGDSVATLRAQRVSRRGQLLWGVRGTLACIGPGDHWYPVLWADVAGGAFVVWEEHPSGIGPVGIWGQHLSARGLPLWGASGRQVVQRLAGNADHQISPDESGGAFITWSSGSGGRTSVYAEHLAARGARLRYSDQVLAEDVSLEPQPQVSPDSRGGAWFAWLAPVSTGNQAIFLRRWTEHGGCMPRETSVGGLNPSRNSAPRLASDGRGGVFVAWLEGPFAPRATHILRGGSVDQRWPVDGTHLDDPVHGSDQLEVISDDADGTIVAWQRGRGFPSADEMVLVQRLGQNGVGEEEGARASPDKVTRSTEPGVALEGFTPNPIREVAEVAFTLTKEGPARIELFDASGRRISRRDVGNLGPGRYVVRLSDKGTLPPGVYFVRLSQRGEAVVARGVVVR